MLYAVLSCQGTDIGCDVHLTEGEAEKALIREAVQLGYWDEDRWPTLDEAQDALNEAGMTYEVRALSLEG